MVKNIELYSFDVFDTLITRCVKVSRVYFALIQEEFAEKYPEVELLPNIFEEELNNEHSKCV